MRPKLVVLAAALAAAACTGGANPAGVPARGSPSLFLPTPSGPTAGQSGPASAAPTAPPLVLPVVATTSGVLAAEDQAYLDGMRLAVEQIDGAGGVMGRPLALEIFDDGGDPSLAGDLIAQALDETPVAVLYAGPGEALSPLRLRFEQLGTPVVLLSGDLYTGHGLFPQVFQTTVPWEWQVNVIARYLVVDRKAGRIVFVGAGSDARTAAEATEAAMAYWGGKLAGSITIPAGGSVEGVEAKARGVDAVVVYGSTFDTGRIAASVAGLRNPPRVAGPASLLSADHRPRPGTVACNSYAWAGWAQPMSRVGGFRSAFAASTGRGVTGPEQEAYEAIRLLAWGLRRTHTTGGPKLVNQLEQAKDLTYSSIPIDLGPDDHLLPPRDRLGLFGVVGPDEQVDPWQIHGTDPWRAIMRTFTTDGGRTSILDGDRPAFFPYWNKYLPGPHYWRSIYGIVTRPKQDPLH